MEASAAAPALAQRSVEPEGPTDPAQPLDPERAEVLGWLARLRGDKPAAAAPSADLPERPIPVSRAHAAPRAPAAQAPAHEISRAPAPPPEEPPALTRAAQVAPPSEPRPLLKTVEPDDSPDLLPPGDGVEPEGDISVLETDGPIPSPDLRATPEAPAGESTATRSEPDIEPGASALGGPAQPAPAPWTPRRDRGPVLVEPSQPLKALLEPLLGLPLEGVPIRQDDDAAELTAAHRAEAATLGETVLLGPEVDLSTPEGAGLLAHELTHVGRRRSPSYLPPVLRPREVATPLADGTARSPNPKPSGLTAADEETLARHVEREVRERARAIPLPLGASPRRASPEPRRQDSAAAAPPAPPERSAPFTSAAPPPLPEHPRAPSPAVADPWGGLPAPWEPLPAALSQPAPIVAASPLAANIGPVAPSAPSLTAHSPAVERGDATWSGSAPLHLAEEGRSLPAAPVNEGPAGPPELTEIELNELARQVYGRLKRRLQQEVRRMAVGR